MVTIGPCLTWLGALLQVVFVLSVLLLAVLKGVAPERERSWNRALALSVWLAAVGAGLDLIAWSANTLAAHLQHTTSSWFWTRPLLLVLPAVVLLIRPLRRSWWWAWAMAIVLVDPFRSFERFVIIITSWHRDYLPSHWTILSPWYSFIIPGSLLLSPLIMLWAQRRSRSAGTADLKKQE